MTVAKVLHKDAVEGFGAAEVEQGEAHADEEGGDLRKWYGQCWVDVWIMRI